MNAEELYRFSLTEWSRVAGPIFPRLRRKIWQTLGDPNATETDYAELIGEVNRAGGPMIGTPIDAEPPTVPAQRLTKTERKILQLVRKSTLQGEAIASQLSLTYGYVRRPLGKLVKAGLLKNIFADGYRTTQAGISHLNQV